MCIRDSYFTEQTPLCPHSPYSASKTSADMVVMAYHDTYKTVSYTHLDVYKRQPVMRNTAESRPQARSASDVPMATIKVT